MTERGIYLPLTWNPDTNQLGVIMPEEKDMSFLAQKDNTGPKLAHPPFLVECVSTFRMRDVVSCKSAEHAMDTITMNEASEFSQEHLGEQIVSARQVEHAEIIALCDRDNDYCTEWDDATKYKNFVHVVDYSK